MCEDQSSNPWKRPYLQHNPFNRWRIQGQSHAARQNSNTAAMPSERSLQLRVNRAQPPRGEADPTPFGTQRCQKGMSLESVRRCALCIKLEMSDINSGNEGSPWASFIATIYHPPCRNAEQGSRSYRLTTQRMARRGHGSTWCLCILLAVYAWKSSFSNARKLALGSTHCPRRSCFFPASEA